MPLPDAPDDPILIERANLISGGSIDTGTDHIIPPNAAEHLLNISTTLDGRRSRRRGSKVRLTLLDATRGSFSSDNPNGAGFLFDSLNSIERLFFAIGPSLYWANDGASLLNGLSQYTLTDTTHAFVQGQGATGVANIFVCTPVPYSGNASLPYDPLIAVDRTGAATIITDVRPRSLLWWQKRLWAFNSAATLHGRDTLAWSNVEDGRNWSNGQTIRVDPEGGDDGVAITPLRGDTPRLLLWKERSIHLLDVFWNTDGYFPGSANQLDFSTAQLRNIVQGTGLVGTRAFAWIPGARGEAGDYMFLSREGIRSLKRSLTDAPGGADLPLSWKIQQQIDRINWSRADIATAAYWDNQVYFAVPVDGSDYNNFVIAYDLRNDAFWFMDLPIAEWVPAKLTRDWRMYFLPATAASDSPFSAPTLTHHLYRLDAGVTDVGRKAITYEERTRAFTFSPDPRDPAAGLIHRKIWRWLESKWRVSGTRISLALDYRIDDTDTWTTFANINIDPSDAYVRLPVNLPFVFDSSTIVRRTDSLHSIPPGYKIQFRFKDDASFGRFSIFELSLRATQLEDSFG